MYKQFSIGVLALSLAGCASLNFSDADDGRGVPFMMPRPYLLLTQAADCSFTGQVLAIGDPTNIRYVRPMPGYGTNSLKAEFENGMLTSFGQDTNVNASDTLSFIGKALSLGAFAPAGAAGAPSEEGDTCEPRATLYAVEGPNEFHPITLAGDE